MHESWEEQTEIGTRCDGIVWHESEGDGREGAGDGSIGNLKEGGGG